MAYKLIVVAIIILVILFLASVISYIPSREDEPARLGISLGERASPCRGSLSVTARSLGGNQCELQANVKVENCENEIWSVFADGCGKRYVCGGEVKSSADQWTCKWKEPKGRYNYLFCIDSTAKDSTNVVC